MKQAVLIGSQKNKHVDLTLAYVYIGIECIDVIWEWIG